LKVHLDAIATTFMQEVKHLDKTLLSPPSIQLTFRQRQTQVLFRTAT